MQGGLIFFGASIAAAFFNYLFQVIASRQLSPKEFADLSAWVANLAPFMVAGGLQYYANFHPARRQGLKMVAALLVVFCAAAILLWPLTSEPTSVPNSALIVGVTAAMMWLMGQTQIRLDFIWLAIGSLVLALGRVVFVLWPAEKSGFDTFVLANLIAPAVVVGILAVKLWPARDVAGAKSGRFWQNALVLSVAGALIPQFDMFLMNHTQGEADFIAFAKASLFGRAVYAMTMIMAQWLLPNQVRGVKRHITVPVYAAVGGIVTACAILAAVSEPVAHHALGWESSPEPLLVFLAGAEISMLAAVFVLIQGMCARNDVRKAIFLLGLLGMEAVIQLIFRLPMNTFLIGALVLQIAAVLIFSKRGT